MAKSEKKNLTPLSKFMRLFCDQLIKFLFSCRPPAARVSGVVQESPGTLEYEVALYREASPRSEDGGNGLTVDLANEIPVDQAVPIGTKLQLRATINDESGKSKATYLQVNLFQKLSFLNQLTHNMTRDCPLNFLKNTCDVQIFF